MNEVTVFGRSDDLIEVRGDIEEEFSANYGDDTKLTVRVDGCDDAIDIIAFYDSAGMWRFSARHRWNLPVEVEKVNRHHEYSYALVIQSSEELTIEKVDEL